MMFWPFALKAVIDRFNCLQLDLDGNSQNSKFLNTKNLPFSVQDYYTFGCPVYILGSKLKSKTIGPHKWEILSCIDYLGNSLMHPAPVALVFDPETGHVSPQYHHFNDTFSSVSCMKKRTIS